MVTLPPRLVSTDFGTCSYQCYLSSFTPVSLHMLKCSCAHALSSLLCTVLLPVLGMLILCGLLSHQIVGKVCICYLSLCSIFLSLNILFVTLGPVLPLFHFIIIIIIIIIQCLLIMHGFSLTSSWRHTTIPTHVLSPKVFHAGPS